MSLSSSSTQDTGKFRTNTKDQFYTDINVAKKCIQTITSSLQTIGGGGASTLDPSSYLWVEPSAGNGSFLHNIPQTYTKIGLDIDPKKPDILCHDFLQWSPPQDNTKPILIFGNPPFGSQSTLAKAFISRSCSFATIIAFILPKSFVKPSMSRAFDPLFHCLHTSNITENAFILVDSTAKHNVPCVFQIWVKRTYPRPVEEKVAENGFEYVKGTDPYDVSFRRVGVYAGRSYINAGNDETDYNPSPQSHHFLKFDEKYEKYIAHISKKINGHKFPSNTVGPRSLSKSEINTVINTILEGMNLSLSL
jgi:hypothetical protein